MYVRMYYACMYVCTYVYMYLIKPGTYLLAKRHGYTTPPDMQCLITDYVPPKLFNIFNFQFYNRLRSYIVHSPIFYANIYATSCSSFMLHFVTKATPINSVNGKCHVKKLKSSRTCLTGY